MKFSSVLFFSTDIDWLGANSYDSLSHKLVEFSFFHDKTSLLPIVRDFAGRAWTG